MDINKLPSEDQTASSLLPQGPSALPPAHIPLTSQACLWSSGGRSVVGVVWGAGTGGGLPTVLP